MPLVATPIYYLIGMAEELVRAQLGVQLDECWCRALIYADNVTLVVDLGQAMLDVEWHMCQGGRWKFNSRKSKVMVVGKREAE